MSINQHCSSDQPQWWSHSQYYPSAIANTSSPSNHLQRATADMFCNFDLNNDDDERHSPPAAADDGEDNISEIPKERLFEKPLTPSDVGKLNRLVIPKQHAEKHFPINGGAAEPGENGLLLGFEDETGKSWRFRYSYWNSSQSYVLTKGWSRFVKEKRLDAGDIVVFARHRVDIGRLFIGWRRRDSGGGGVSQPAAAVANGGGWGRVFYPGQYGYPSQHLQAGPVASFLPYQSDPIHAETIVPQQQNQTANGNSKRLRLFGVNMECYDESEPSTPLGSPMSSQSQAQAQAHYPYHHQHQYYSNNHMVTLLIFILVTMVHFPSLDIAVSP
ncbi:hypothetical protein CASFOL_013533 [Castilleja foliolosa]|uniref:TF-B3 domain-containing protein n=1 Tax=Castilleja foliolosa TaxID=1961234 RepID=A0ABD3DK91_9LAMI